MITDAELTFSDGQDVSGAGTKVSTNVVDLLSANNNIGRGADRRVFVAVTTALVGGTSIAANLVESDNEDLSSPTVLHTGAVMTVAKAVQGAELLDIPMPDNGKRYLGVQYVVVGAVSEGEVFATLLADTDHQPYLPANTGR